MKCEKSHIDKGNHHNCCCRSSIKRGFLTNEEKIKQLTEYKNELEKEIKGVEQVIQKMKKD